MRELPGRSRDHETIPMAGTEPRRCHRHPFHGCAGGRYPGTRRFGARVRLELERADGNGTIEAEVTRERFLEQEFRPGERVFARPQNPRVFIDPTEPLS